MARYREKHWPLCTLLAFLGGSLDFTFMILFGHDARAMFEEIIAGSGQDRSMGDLIPMFSRRDVRSHYLGVPPRLTQNKEHCGLSHRRIWHHADRGLADEIYSD